MLAKMASPIDETIIKDCKKVIEEGNLVYLQEMFVDILEMEDVKRRDWAYIFQKIYLHACLKGKEEIAAWLQGNVFPLMDPIQQVACRNTFTYGAQMLESYKSKMTRRQNYA
jgi:hypothetical protein